MKKNRNTKLGLLVLIVSLVGANTIIAETPEAEKTAVERFFEWLFGKKVANQQNQKTVAKNNRRHDNTSAQKENTSASREGAAANR